MTTTLAVVGLGAKPVLGARTTSPATTLRWLVPLLRQSIYRRLAGHTT